MASGLTVMAAGEVLLKQEVATPGGSAGVVSFSYTAGAKALVLTVDTAGNYKIATSIVGAGAPTNPSAPTDANTATADGIAVRLAVGIPVRLESNQGSAPGSAGIAYCKVYSPANAIVYANWMG